jgi:succinate-semialdehyde dehydrogenase/glutarate-semialdehyde dehydrogenase|tara:strand:- start:57 stop:1487 length:1431 start_codon:yes stop_codon:yes gene_type:complete
MEFFINGEWCPSESTSKISVLNPATGEIVGEVPRGTDADADYAICVAKDAFEGWRATPMSERAKLQHAAAEGLRSKAEQLAKMLTLEVGRPFSGAQNEIERSADLLSYYAEEGLRLRGEIPMLNLPDERVLVIKEPVGVVVAITPFNYPITLLTLKLGAALITGCTVVAKPADETPLTTLMVAEIFHEVGYPPGVFNVVCGHGDEIGKALVSHPTPRKISFTGGTKAGKQISKIASQTNKRLTLELGGQCPAIVCDDADLDIAIPALLQQSFANSGQFCYRVNRMYVQHNIYDIFCEHFSAKARALKVGKGFDPESQIGPLINKNSSLKAESHVDDALSKGAKINTGGNRLTGGDYDQGYYWPPTVLTKTCQSMKIMNEETFAPVVGIMKFENLDEAMQMANDSPFGLAAFLFTGNHNLALRTAERFEAGSVWVNGIHRSYNQVPFGGYKESGLGREKSRYGLEEYLELKTIYLSI